MHVLIVVAAFIAIVALKVGVSFYGRKRRAQGTAGFFWSNLLGPNYPRERTFPYRRIRK